VTFSHTKKAPNSSESSSDSGDSVLDFKPPGKKVEPDSSAVPKANTAANTLDSDDSVVEVVDTGSASSSTTPKSTANAPALCLGKPGGGGSGTAAAKTGSRVVLNRIVSKPKMNGKKGTVTGPVDSSTGRLPVSIDGAGTMAINPTKLRAMSAAEAATDKPTAKPSRDASRPGAFRFMNSLPVVSLPAPYFRVHAALRECLPLPHSPTPRRFMSHIARASTQGRFSFLHLKYLIKFPQFFDYSNRTQVFFKSRVLARRDGAYTL